MQIRKAKPKDAKGSFKVIQSDDLNHLSEKAFVNASKNKLIIYFVAEHKKEIIGFILGFYSPLGKKAFISEVRVLKNFRSKKIGTKFVSHFCRFVFNNKVTRVYNFIERRLIPFYCGSCKFKKVNNWIEVVKKK